MNTKKPNHLLAVLFLGAALALPGSSAIAAAQKSFATPEAAMEAIGSAIIDNDDAALRGMLGKDVRKLIPPIGSDVRYQFIEGWAKSHRIEADGERLARIGVGDKGWTLPIPLVKTASGWRFDMKAGEKEIAIRQIGRNELAAIQVALAYVDAQKEYAAIDRNGDGVPEYARKIRSSPGKTDGLYWPADAGAGESPLGPRLAAAEPGQQPTGSYHGYRYRILTAQGPAAPGGARSYLVDGRLTGGFGLVMWPATYGQTGVMSFMVNQDGQVYEKNLGADSARQASHLQTFNPDATWRKVDDSR
jgi:hypothetical protein